MTVINQYNGINLDKLMGAEIDVLKQIATGLISKAITSSLEVYVNLFNNVIVGQLSSQ